MQYLGKDKRHIRINKIRKENILVRRWKGYFQLFFSLFLKTFYVVFSKDMYLEIGQVSCIGAACDSEKLSIIGTTTLALPHKVKCLSSGLASLAVAIYPSKTLAMGTK